MEGSKGKGELRRENEMKQKERKKEEGVEFWERRELSINVKEKRRDDHEGYHKPHHHP